MTPPSSGESSLTRAHLDNHTRSSGAGPIGLVTLLAARAAGAEPIVITDLVQGRLDFAKGLVPGVRPVLIRPDEEDAERSAARVKDAAQGPLRVALECTGVESSVRTAIYVSSKCCCGFGMLICWGRSRCSLEARFL